MKKKILIKTKINKIIKMTTKMTRKTKEMKRKSKIFLF